jgi:hypothetical protein
MDFLRFHFFAFILLTGAAIFFNANIHFIAVIVLKLH